MAEKSEKPVPREGRGGGEREGRGVSVWDPFGDWGLFERGFPFRELALRGRLPRWIEDVGKAGGLAPAMDVTESEAAYTITAELPGVKRDDVHVELNDGVLTIRGEKRSEREEKKERSRWVERSFGSFSRSFTLPRDASPDHIDASFQDGVLTLRIAKTETSKPRSIAIKG